MDNPCFGIRPKQGLFDAKTGMSKKSGIFLPSNLNKKEKKGMGKIFVQKAGMILGDLERGTWYGIISEIGTA